MNKDRFALDTSKAGDTAMANAILRAQEKAAKENKPNEPAVLVQQEEAVKEEAVATIPIVTISAVNEIETVDMSDSAFVEWQKKAQEEKEAADAVGRKLTEIRRKIRQTESDPNFKGTSVGEQIIASLKKAEAKLKNLGDETFQKRAEGYALVEEVKVINPAHFDEVKNIFHHLNSAKTDLRHFVTKEDVDKMTKRDGLIFFDGKISISNVEGKEKTGFHRALEAELRKLVDKAKITKTAVIASGNADLTGYGAGKPGSYHFSSPYKKGEDGREYFEGHATVRLFDVNKDRNRPPYIKVEISKATGSLGWGENHSGRRPIPLSWIRLGEIPTDKEKEMTSDQVSYAKRAIGNLRRIYGEWKKGLNPEAAKLKEEKSEEPAFTTSNVDMTDVVVENVKTEKAEKPKSKKAAKKAE